MVSLVQPHKQPLSMEQWEAAADLMGKVNKEQPSQQDGPISIPELDRKPVNEGQTLSQIAAQAGITLEELYRLNPQFDPDKADGKVDSERKGNSGWDPDFIRPGDVIVLPGKSSGGTAPGNAGGTDGSTGPNAPDTDRGTIGGHEIIPLSANGGQVR